jgi:hypothetical protein
MRELNIITLDTTHSRQVKQFLDLPFRLYRDVPQWVPPLAVDARRMLDRKRHPFYRHSDAAFFLALADGIAVGRLAVLDNRNYNAYNREQTAFFTLFECEDNAATAHALFDAAGNWARDRGLTHIFGPKGFTALDGMGLLVKGFEHRPAFGIPYNLPTYPALLESCGFAPAGDVLSGYLGVDTVFPEKIHQIAARVQERRGLRVLNFRRRRDLRALVPVLQAMYNAAIADTPDNVPLTDDEVRAIAAQLLWFADPRLIKLIVAGSDERPVGFLFAYPDISAAVQRCRGCFFPFGWLDMLLELRRTPWLNLNGAGIIEEYRGMGGTAILFSEVQKSIVERGATHLDLVQIGADNARMQRELRDLGVDFYKTHRMYRKELEIRI